MENPFKKLFKGEAGALEETSGSETEHREEKTVADVNFEVRDDGLYAQDVYDDGSVNLDWTILEADPSDPASSERAMRSYKRQKGIVEEDMVNM